MNNLPTDVLNLSWNYIHPIYKYNLNKALFDKYYKVPVNSKNISYISNIIRNDCNFIFKSTCKLNWIYWQKQRRISYKNYKFPNYNHFVLYLIRKYKADKCRIIYLDYDDDKLCKKKTKIKGKNRYWGN